MLFRSGVIALSVSVSVAACGSAPAEPRGAEAGAPIAVQVVTVARTDRAGTLEAGGTLHGRRFAVVASRVMGTVVAVPVAAGDRVRAGQLLVQLDDAAVTAEVRASAAGREAAVRGLDRARAERTAALAAAGLARTTHGRIAALAERRSATAQELDEAAAALAAAEAQATAAEAAVSAAEAEVARATAGGEGAGAVAAWSRVTAPFDGVVTETMVDPGALAAPGSPLVRVEETSALEFDARLDDSRAGWAKPGASVRVLVDADGAVLEREGRITEVGRSTSVDARAVMVTIAMASAEGLRPGMFGRALLPGPERAVMTVPASALVRRGQLTSVFVIDDGTARMRLVRIGASDGADVEIAGGPLRGRACGDGAAGVVA